MILSACLRSIAAHTAGVAILMVLSAWCIGCSATQYYVPASSLAADSLKRATDDDIAAILRASPQLVKPFTVALYNTDDTPSALADSVRRLSFVKSVGEIPPMLVEGDGFYSRKNRWYRYSSTQQGLNLQQLRVAAARYKADVLIVCCPHYEYRQEANAVGWITYWFLVPMLFAPGIDAHLESDVTLFCIDVRNGFLYGSYTTHAEVDKKFVTLAYQSEENLEDLRRTHLATLVPGLTQAIDRILSREEYYLHGSR